MRQSHKQSTVHVESNSTVVVPFPVPKSDVGLVAALRSGHSDALRVLCERHSGELLRIATRILGPDDGVGAVVAEAVQRSLEKLDELTEPRALRIWLLSQVVAVARQRLRARRRWRWVGGRKQPSYPARSERCSEQLLVTYRVLDRMSDDQRIVFCLVVIHSMGLAEAAMLLGGSLASVRATLERAYASFGDHSRNEPSVLTQRKRFA
jgi:RNA polymerase sigma-70 factor (ECF subfamily)